MSMNALRYCGYNIQTCCWLRQSLRGAIGLQKQNFFCNRYPDHIKLPSYEKFHTSCQSQLPLPSYEDPSKEKYIYSRWERLRMKFGFLPIDNATLYRTSVMLHESCVDGINYLDFFSFCRLPDTMHSWFLITELHIWMCMVRLTSEGKHGRRIRNDLVSNMWRDVDLRCKRLGAMSSSKKKEGLVLLNDHFQAAILSYDEGLLSDDKVLAGAIWRILFSYAPDVEASVIETIVKYIRKQVSLLDNVSQKEILTVGKIEWTPIIPKVKYS